MVRVCNAAARIALLGLAVLATWLLSAHVAAQAAEARVHFDAGREHARAERWAEALGEFRTSEALLPRAGTEFNIASALIRLGRAREALAQIAGTEARADLDDAMRRDLASLRTAAEASLRTLTLIVSPGTARIEIDGAVQEGTGERREIVLDPGAHVVLVTAPGHAEARSTLGADEHVLAITLEPLPATLVVDASPLDAEIQLDGASGGRRRLERSVAAGTHRVRVALDGHIPLDLEVVLEPGEHRVIDAPLVPIEPVPLTSEPAFWAVIGGGVAVVIGVAIGVGVAVSSQPQAYGGTSGVVIAPLLRF